MIRSIAEEASALVALALFMGLIFVICAIIGGN